MADNADGGVDRAVPRARADEGREPLVVYCRCGCSSCRSSSSTSACSAIGREHLPRSGPLLLAANHRSFLDPFVIGTLVRRPVYYMAKRELFEKRWQAWMLNALGAFPVDRGAGDRDAMDTARAILAARRLRGACSPRAPACARGRSADPRRGIGRLALETGAPVARSR